MPKTAMRASPGKASTVPPWRSSTARIAASRSRGGAPARLRVEAGAGPSTTLGEQDADRLAQLVAAPPGRRRRAARTRAPAGRARAARAARGPRSRAPCGSRSRTSSAVACDTTVVPPAASRAQPCGAVDRRAEEVAVALLRLARVQRRPHAQRQAAGPRGRRQRVLQRGRGGDGVGGARGTR